PAINIDGLIAHIKQWTPATEATTPTAEDFGITDENTQNSSLLPNLATQTIQLKNILISYADQSSAMDTRFDIKNLSANIDEIDLNKEVVRLRELMLDGSDSYVLLGKTTKQLQNNNDTSCVNWVVSAERLSIDKTNFWFKDDNQPRMKGFDYFNIKITDLGGALDDLYYSSDSISGSLANLTAKDHSGFYLKQLKGDFEYTNTGAEIKNLLAQTPRTTIRDYIKISYPSLDVLSDNLQSLQINANIRKTQIDMTDIRFFVPDLDTMEVMKPLLTKSFYIDSRISGKLNDLHIPLLVFKSIYNTEISASSHIKGLPDVDRMNIDLDVKKLNTSKRDLDQLIAKSLLPKDFQFPNVMALSGTLSGGMSGFDANMSLHTDKGNATVNGNLN